MTFRSANTVILIVALAFCACGQQSFDQMLSLLYKNTVPKVQPEELDSLEHRENVVILDTRAPEEYKVSHIQGARLIDYDNFQKKDVKDIPRDAQVILYCSVGYRSERIGEKMQEMGFQNVSNLYGGIFEWKNQGREVVNMNNEPTDSVHAYNAVWSVWLKNGVKVYE